MKNTESLTKYYSDFTPMERLNLVIAAKTRGDNDEIKKLFKTCPKHQYIQADANFVDRYYEMVDVGLIFINHWEKYSNAISLFYIIYLACHDQISIYEWAIELAGQDETKKADVDKAEKEIKELEKIIAKMSKKTDDKMIEIKTLITAYRQFCNEIGLQEEAALKWVGADTIDLIPPQHLENIDTDEEFLQKIKSLFYRVWGKH